MKKDLPLALKIKEVIKGGTIVHPGNSDYLNLLFQDINSIQKIAEKKKLNKITKELGIGMDVFISYLKSFLSVPKDL